MNKIAALLFLLAVSFSSCEKDDICDANTPTTPRLVIYFYNYLDPTVSKSVTNLKVIGDGLVNGIIFNTSGTSVTKYLANAPNVKIPLNLAEDVSRFNFILNASDPLYAKTDLLEFNYSRQLLYVSRACGYKTLFQLNQDNLLPNPFVLNNNNGATEGNWIRNITVEKYNLENENETHIKIYF